MFIFKSTLKFNPLRNAPLRRNFLPKSMIPGIAPEVNTETNQERQLKKWRKDPINMGEATGSILSMLNGETDRKEFPLYISRGSMPTTTDVTNYWRQYYIDNLDHDQRYQPERHQILGNDLAAAHFVVAREGKVRQLGTANFIKIENLLEIPSTYVADWFIEEIDFSNVEISYNGLINFKGLRYLKRMTFRNCKYFDDWCLERVVALCPKLEYLDVSECEKVTERGLEGIYRAWKLKKLVITDFYQSPSFELTCLLVEDCMPDLKIERLLSPKKETKNDFTFNY